MSRVEKVKVNLPTLAVMLYNIYVASKEERLGILDADRTLDDLVKSLNKDVWVKIDLLESALFCCNHLDEMDLMWHPRDISFDTFVKNALPKGLIFDKMFSIVEEADVK